MDLFGLLPAQRFTSIEDACAWMDDTALFSEQMREVPLLYPVATVLEGINWSPEPAAVDGSPTRLNILNDDEDTWTEWEWEQHEHIRDECQSVRMAGVEASIVDPTARATPQIVSPFRTRIVKVRPKDPQLEATLLPLEGSGLFPLLATYVQVTGWERWYRHNVMEPAKGSTRYVAGHRLRHMERAVEAYRDAFVASTNSWIGDIVTQIRNTGLSVPNGKKQKNPTGTAVPGLTPGRTAR